MSRFFGLLPEGTEASKNAGIEELFQAFDIVFAANNTKNKTIIELGVRHL